MELELWRYSSDDESTLGLLFERTPRPYQYGREMLCFTLEDAYHPLKIPGKTRIPAGAYEIKLRCGTPMAERYAKRYPFHVGMLWLQDVPGFTDIYLHTGNDEGDTEGCPLVGGIRYEGSRTVGQSQDTYRRIYPRIANALGSGGCLIHVLDGDRLPDLPG